MTKIYLDTVGCSLNFADSEQMAGLLKQAQFEIVNHPEEADIIIFNTCTVKSPTETAFFKKLNETKERYPYKIIIIAGCIAQTDPLKLKGYSLVGTKQIQNIVEVVEEALNDNIIQMLETSEVPPLNLPRIKKNSTISIIPISRGCLGACSFCKTKSARGNLISYPISEIKKEAQTAILNGAKELWLTSQDTGCYGFDLKTNLPDLIKELLKITDEFKIRIGMMNPDHLLKIKDELLPLFNDHKLFQFLHIPLQSGSDGVLKKMNRNYNVQDYFNLITEIKNEFPLMTIGTDIIVGFPGETEEQYWETLNLIKKTSPDIVNISRFWPRTKTPAAKMKQLPGEVIKHRSRILTDICQNIFRMQNERWLGWEGEIIIDEIDETNKENVHQQYIGRNVAYKKIIVDGNHKLGQKLKVRIIKTATFDLKGEIIENHLQHSLPYTA